MWLPPTYHLHDGFRRILQTGCKYKAHRRKPHAVFARQVVQRRLRVTLDMVRFLYSPAQGVSVVEGHVVQCCLLPNGRDDEVVARFAMVEEELAGRLLRAMDVEMGVQGDGCCYRLTSVTGFL